MHIMTSPRFFVSRYASEARHDRYAYRAVESILRVYPGARVTVVDDGSPPEFAYVPPTGDEPGAGLVDVATNPYPRSGEMGTLFCARAALESDDDAAVTMHDTMVLLGPLPRLGPAAGASDAPADDVRFLWHFDRHHLLHMRQVVRILAAIPDQGIGGDTMLTNFVHHLVSDFNRKWRGCFGVALFATKRALDRMHASHCLFSDEVMRAVDSREMRQAAERVVGLVAHVSRPALEQAELVPSLCGCIFDHPSPWDSESASWSLDRVLAERERVSFAGPVFKSWAGR